MPQAGKSHWMEIEGKSWKLKSGIELRALGSSEFSPLLKRYRKEIFDDNVPIFRPYSFYSEGEKLKVDELHKYIEDLVQIRLCAFDKGEFVGWSYSQQDKGSTLYMQNSAILPAYRRQGLYTEMVKVVMAIATDAGFQSIFSRHIATNNDVIIAKLKLGFNITGMELSDAFGTLVHLTYLPNETRKQFLDFRAGLTRPNEKIKEHLKFNS
jgi:ribosomal protein S18 acetylase RimI-like enzyme